MNINPGLTDEEVTESTKNLTALQEKNGTPFLTPKMIEKEMKQFLENILYEKEEENSNENT